EVIDNMSINGINFMLGLYTNSEGSQYNSA
ncbi:hypothetical protein LCGC14_2294190, partial [marine sediment metagenome]